MKIRQLWQERGSAPINTPIRYTDALSFSHLGHRWGAVLDESEQKLTDEEILRIAVPLAELGL